MDIKILKEINLDFYDKQYVTITAKQGDSCSRFILISCFNQKKPVLLNTDEHFACIRYSKPDGYAIINTCIITTDGKILVKLTEQMLSTSGTCFADIMIINKAQLPLDTIDTLFNFYYTEESNSSILSTMQFRVRILPTPVSDFQIESSNEFNALNELLEKALNDYEYVIEQAKLWGKYSKSYAVGGTNEREGEDIDNAKYYYELVKNIKDNLITYSSSTPRENSSSGSAGSESSVARSDHSHPLQRSVARLSSMQNIDGVPFDGTSDINHYGFCSTSSNIREKTVSMNNINLEYGAKIAIKFSNGNTAINPSLKINSLRALPIYYKGNPVPPNYIKERSIIELIYENNSRWDIVGDLNEDINTESGSSSGLNNVHILWEGTMAGCDLANLNQATFYVPKECISNEPKSLSLYIEGFLGNPSASPTFAKEGACATVASVALGSPYYLIGRDGVTNNGAEYYAYANGGYTLITIPSGNFLADNEYQGGVEIKAKLLADERNCECIVRNYISALSTGVFIITRISAIVQKGGETDV